MEIKLHDRVKHVDGRTGTVIHDDKMGSAPLLVHWDGCSFVDWACRENNCEIAEVTGHRYFVDTPFTIGETYRTYFDSAKVTGVGLIVESAVGRMEARNADGTDANDSSALNLTLPEKPEEINPASDWSVEYAGKKYRLTPVEGE